MTSNPLLAARPSAMGLASPKTGADKPPFKSILREPSSRAMKRKMDDRYETDADRQGEKRRRIVDNNEDGDKENAEGDEEEGEDVREKQQGSSEDGVADTDEKGIVVVGKRQKTVHFDMNLNITTEVGRRTLEETKISVRRALQNHNIAANQPGHDDQDYIELVDVFSHDAEAFRKARSGGGHDDVSDVDDDDDYAGNTVRPDDLVLYVVALTSCAPLLNKTCFNLVRQVLACSWLGRDDKFFRAYVQFLTAVVSAQGGYLRPALEMILDWFKEPSPSSWTVPDFPEVSSDEAQKRLHFALRHMLRLFPASRTIISKLISQKFPFPAESRSVHVLYVDNLLQLREYAPALGADILETITSHLVKIDTEFQLDLSDMDDDLVTRVMFELANKGLEKNGAGALHAEDRDDKSVEGHANAGEDEDGHDEDDEGDDDDDEDEDDDSEDGDGDIQQFGDPDFDEEVARVDKSTKLVQKLDSILDRLFTLFTPMFENPDSIAARTCLEDMMSDFANFVLTVPSSRHTQFLIFHFSQKSLALQDIFTGTLLNLGFESNRPAAVRQSAAAYLSSYVARAARVPRDTVRNVTSILCHRIESFRRRHVDACRGPDLRRYQELYSWVQALLYIFCFRWRDLVDSYPEDLVDPEDPASFVGKDLDWMPDLKPALSNIIYAAFNPLIVCSPPIVGEFAKLAHSLRFMYVFPRIESNKSIQLSQFASGRYMHGDALREDAGYAADDETKWLQLEGNFPFDPYNLPVSKRWLEGDYVAWTPIPGVGGGPASDSGDSDSDSDDGYDGYDEDPKEYDEDPEDRF